MTNRREPEKSKEETAVTAGRPPRTRSPNYPAINLKAAVEKARTIYQSSTKRHAVGPEVIGQVWGNKPKSSAFKLALAAMQYFGLLAEAPNGDHKLLKLTPLALDIIADFPAGSDEHREAIQKAALMPKVHAELWSRWGAGLPPDGEIRRYLVRERGFNDNTVGDFIAEYKATLSFAKLTGDGTLEEETPTDDGEGGVVETTSNVRNAAGAGTPKPPPTGYRDLPVTLPSLEIATLRVQVPMSEEDYNALAGALTAMKKALVKPPGS